MIIFGVYIRIKVCKQMTQMFHLFPSSYHMNDLSGFNITTFDYFTILQANLKYKALLKRRQSVRLFHNAVGFYLLTTSDLRWVNVRHNWEPFCVA
jgi:hypothetical protein